jgi:hypothetical protein
MKAGHAAVFVAARIAGEQGWTDATLHAMAYDYLLQSGNADLIDGFVLHLKQVQATEASASDDWRGGPTDWEDGL